MKKTRKIFITEHDKSRLEELLAAAGDFGKTGRDDLALLAGELERAKVVSSREIPPDVVTMNSKVRLKDMKTSEEVTYTLGFPNDADVAEGIISVLAPVGTAILGYSKGDVIEWPVPDGKRMLRIEDVIYQPEASGDYHL